MLCTVLFICSIPKLLAPTKASRLWVRKKLAHLPEFWISVNNAVLGMYRQPTWTFDLPPELEPEGCYAVVSNHQSWVDVLVLQRCLNRKLPLFRFFIKSQLFWVPFLGLSWWTLDMPFVHRYTKEEIQKNPALRGQDLESARRACEKFKGIPVAMTCFPEGTRFSVAKRDQSGSPYRHLLEPKVGAVAQVFYALGSELDHLVDITIVYPQARAEGRQPSFWDLMSVNIPEVVIKARLRPIAPELLGKNYREDSEFREALSGWMTTIWQEKDDLISGVLSDRNSAGQERQGSEVVPHVD